LEKVAAEADAILRLQPSQDPPIDPFKIAASEGDRLRLYADDFRNRFDGQLEYLKKPQRFVIFLNNKYDQQAPPGKHHPRTRFSLSHELGHLYLEHHVAHLLRGGKPHGSKGEFQHDEQLELEADAFASALLMPSTTFGYHLNRREPTVNGIRALSAKFETSLTATLFRAVNLSDFPCALVSIQDGLVRWCFVSPPLMEAGCYPSKQGPIQSKPAFAAWQAYKSGAVDIAPGDSQVRSWFQTYDKDESLGASVTEEYLALSWRTDLLIWLTVSEDELHSSRESDDDDED
jgi:hypothetical protein